MNKITEEQKKLPYAKYLNIPMTRIPEEKTAALNAPLSPDEMLKITDRNLLFKEGYLPKEIGYGKAEDGSGYVANLTAMPGVTKEMFEWWFAWHALEDVRYMIWDPEDHYFSRQQDIDKAMNENLPMRERTWGTTHYVLEDIGVGPDYLLLDFAYPKDFGYDQEKVDSKYCASMMCANGHGVKPGQGLTAVMTHMIREIEDGIELRSRFWIGYQIVNGKAVKVLPDDVLIPMEACKKLFAHNIKEFTHLAAILPEVYRENRDNF